VVHTFVVLSAIDAVVGIAVVVGRAIKRDKS
jgi:hypothetical protein